MSENVIKVTDISKLYDLGEVKVHALRGVSVSVRRGEFVAIMGPSGSGKSTFMNILGCLDKPTAGGYILNGTEVSKMSADELADVRNALIGFVFQGYNLLPRMTAAENVELPLFYARDKGYTHKEKRDLSLKSLDAVGLSDRYGHLPKQMSGGQQQRVAIARSLVTSPSLILADEPTGNLDSRTSAEIMKIFQDLNTKQNITVVLVTHSNEIAEYADRIIVFKDGRVIDDRQVENKLDASKVLAAMPPQEEDYL